MQPISSVQNRPIVIQSSSEMQVYSLFALAMALTAIGVFFGIQAEAYLFNSGIILFLLIAELALIFTSSWWSRSRFAIIFFGLFPLISGATLAPYLLSVTSDYVNGGLILLDAFGATACMSIAAAVFARTTLWNFASLGRVLLIGLIGLVILGVVQVFVPSLQTGPFELVLSGVGVMLFAFLLVYDLQRIQQLGRYGMSPFNLALGLYLDVFNLFLYVLRFMLQMSGRRR